MYKIRLGPLLTKYFLSWSEAKTFAQSCGLPLKRIKSVH